MGAAGEIPRGTQLELLEVADEYRNRTLHGKLREMAGRSGGQRGARGRPGEGGRPDRGAGGFFRDQERPAPGHRPETRKTRSGGQPLPGGLEDRIRVGSRCPRGLEELNRGAVVAPANGKTGSAGAAIALANWKSCPARAATALTDWKT